jgi:hypothetical protein
MRLKLQLVCSPVHSAVIQRQHLNNNAILTTCVQKPDQSQASILISAPPVPVPQWFNPGQRSGVHRGERCEKLQLRSPVDHSDITTLRMDSRDDCCAIDMYIVWKVCSFCFLCSKPTASFLPYFTL